MKNLVRKTSILALTVLFSFTCLFYTVGAFKIETDVDIVRATETLDNYLNTGDDYWKDFTVYSIKELVDPAMNDYGYVFDLVSNSNKYGYVIVLDVGGMFAVIESCFESKSPYLENSDKGDVYIYGGPLSYYMTEDLKVNPSVFDVSTNSYVEINHGSFERIQANQAVQFARSSSHASKYLTGYSSNFEKIQQHNNISCIPTSMAMALKYLHNSGQINITSSSLRNTSTLAITLYNNMYSSQYPNMIEASHVAPGLAATITRSTCANKVTTNSGVFSNLSYGTLVEEINGDYPVVLMFLGDSNFGSTYIGTNANHATTLVGYRADTSGNYVRVVDPLQAVEKELRWLPERTLGYFILYVYGGW